MNTTREFAPASRYLYDFGLCSYEKGFCQVDTSQDAEYFGTWASIDRLIIFNYCEGDTTMQECSNLEEFGEELRKMKKWNEDNGHKFFGVDPGFPDSGYGDFKAKFQAAGLDDLLH